MNDFVLDNTAAAESSPAPWTDETEIRLSLWLTAAEAETLSALCIGGEVSPHQETAVMGRLNELLRAFWR